MQEEKKKTLSVEERLEHQEKMLKAMMVRIKRIDKQLKMEMLFRWIRYAILILLVLFGVSYVSPYVVEVYDAFLEVNAALRNGSVFDLFRQ